MDYETQLQVFVLEFSWGNTLRPDQVETLVEEGLLERTAEGGVHLTQEGQELRSAGEDAIKDTSQAKQNLATQAKRVTEIRKKAGC